MQEGEIYQISTDDVEIYYDGAYPGLCMGTLVVIIKGVPYDFGKYVLESGGSCGFSDDYSDSYTSEGPWSIDDDHWPKNLSSVYRPIVLEKINEVVPWGCCGGCL